MLKSRPQPANAAHGFSMLELLMVVTIISIMAAISVPIILSHLHTYRLTSAVQELSAEFSAARLRAIQRNTVNGVSLVILDANSYRIVTEDDVVPGFPGTGLSPVRDLPSQIQFQPGTNSAVRFLRLGTSCNPEPPPLLAPDCGTQELPWDPGDPQLCNGEFQCTDVAVGNYVTALGSAGASVTLVDLRDPAQTRQLDIGLGGRVSELR